MSMPEQSSSIHAYDGDTYRKAVQSVRDAHSLLISTSPETRVPVREAANNITIRIKRVYEDALNLIDELPEEEQRKAMELLHKIIVGYSQASLEVLAPNTDRETVKHFGSSTDLITDRQGLQALRRMFF